MSSYHLIPFDDPCHKLEESCSVFASELENVTRISDVQIKHVKFNIVSFSIERNQKKNNGRSTSGKPDWHFRLTFDLAIVSFIAKCTFTSYGTGQVITSSTIFTRICDTSINGIFNGILQHASTRKIFEIKEKMHRNNSSNCF